MKGPVITLFIVLIAGLCILTYFNFEQKNTIEVLNQEIVRQARYRHQLQIEKQKVERKFELALDSLVNKQAHLEE